MTIKGKVQVHGTLQAVTRKRYKDGKGEAGATLVAVFEGENPLYPLVVSVSKENESGYEDRLRDAIGSEVTLDVFVGGFRSLWLIDFAE